MKSLSTWALRGGLGAPGYGGAAGNTASPLQNLALSQQPDCNSTHNRITFHHIHFIVSEYHHIHFTVSQYEMNHIHFIVLEKHIFLHVNSEMTASHYIRQHFLLVGYKVLPDNE